MSLPGDDYWSARLPHPESVPEGLDGVVASWRGWRVRRQDHLSGLFRRQEAIHTETLTLRELSDAHLNQHMQKVAPLFRQGGVGRETVDRAMAILAETARRSVGMEPYPVQIVGALALHEGFLAEMATGEGKSLTACFPAILAGWSGRPCHLLTANDYLAERDAEEMQPFYRAAGLEVGSVGDGMEPEQRAGIHLKSVVYTTSKELLGDFLRDRLSLGGRGAAGRRLIERVLHWPRPPKGLVLRGIHTLIVDEADSILIDEAVTPFIISAPHDNPILQEAVGVAQRLAQGLLPGRDYRVDSRRRDVTLTDRGWHRLAEDAEMLPGLWRGSRRREELVLQSLRARELFERDKDYVVHESKIVLVDAYTGRMTPNRTLGIGLHQALEAKEGIEITPPTETLARFSYQKFFRMAPRLCGMSGTVMEAADEIWRIYRLPVLSLPTHRPLQRQQYTASAHATQADKWRAIELRVQKAHAIGLPVLVGTHSVHDSERMAARLRRQGFGCRVLNAVRHEEEAAIIAKAGGIRRVTIATNMAGRGTDIKLTDEIKGLGGLMVIAAEPHASPRVDRQLFGRAGRQGDPGGAMLVFSLEDPLFRTHLPEPVRVLFVALLKMRLPLSQPLARWLLKRLQNRAERLAARNRHAILKADRWLEEFLIFPESSR
ncbi:MAG: hypothetical protein HQL50_05220 [Magnetococcales bacterium]|nr:hypothetical protein [Magnetococcales bacterium]